MKKRFLALMMATTLFATVLPVSATELTNVNQAGDTSVEADIMGEDTGDVTYIIAIPEKIDFGTLVMPENADSATAKTVGFTVSAVEIKGLDTNTSRVAVLMKDADAAMGTFQIRGINTTNATKVLNYNVLNSQGTDLTTGKSYANGYAFAAFSAAGQAVNGTLSLDQKQLLDDPVVANWAGNYLGSINFYTAIAEISSFN